MQQFIEKQCQLLSVGSDNCTSTDKSNKIYRMKVKAETRSNKNSRTRVKKGGKLQVLKCKYKVLQIFCHSDHMDRVKRISYLSPVRAAKVQASLRIRAVSPEPPLLAHTSTESRGTFRQKARSLAPLNGWACAVKICHDGMLEDTNSLDGAHMTTQNEVFTHTKTPSQMNESC